MSWENGRSLISATDGETEISYVYDKDGLRVSKTVDGVVHNYIYASGKLLRETYGSTVLDFFYDANGTPYALKVNGTTYYYVTNLQGDVVQVVNANGMMEAYYEYDPYGNIVYQTGVLVDTNPLRYRGYYYDSETGFYYLQSRYYDPEIGRFINADSYASTGQGMIGHNMFSYCGNNPVMRIDASGEFFFTALGSVTGFIAGALTAMATESDSSKWFDLAVAGAAGGAIAGLGVDAGILLVSTLGMSTPVVLTAFASAYVLGGVGNVYTTHESAQISGTELESAQYLGTFIIGGTFNCMSMATSFSSTACTVDRLFIEGMQNLEENTWVGTAIGVSTSIATSIGTAPAPSREYQVGAQKMQKVLFEDRWTSL